MAQTTTTTTTTNIADTTEDALDAIKMCNAAKSCLGFHKDIILSEAIADLLWAFHPAADFKYTGSREELDKLYADYLANANIVLIATRQQPIPTSINTTIPQLREALHDTVKMCAAAKTCVGTRRRQILAKTEANFIVARDAYERKTKVDKVGGRWFCFWR
jgi:hypothetical protein